MTEILYFDGFPSKGNIVGTEIPPYSNIENKIAYPKISRMASSPDKSSLLSARVSVPYMVVSESLGVVNNSSKGTAALNNAAQSVNAPIEQFINIRNSMRIKGVDEYQSIQSTQELYSKFNTILSGQNRYTPVLLNLLNSYGVGISRNENGTADIPNTMLDLARVFPIMAPQDQNTLISTTSFNNDAATLLREGEGLGNLFSQAKNLGNSFNPELHQRKVRFDQEMNKLGFFWDSFIEKQQDKVSNVFTYGDYLSNFMSSITAIRDYDPEKTSDIEHYMRITGNDYDMSWYKTMNEDPEFTQQLNKSEMTALLKRYPLRSLNKKYSQYKQIKDDDSAASNSAITGEIPGFISPDRELNQLTGLFNFGAETENTWKNNRLTDIHAEEPSSDFGYNDIDINPVNPSLISPESAGDFTGSAIADVIATAMQNNRVQIELTLIDSRTGETSLIQAQGGARIAHAMELGH
ncbi:coat protein [Yersinia pseudotuberculosis]